MTPSKPVQIKPTQSPDLLDRIERLGSLPANPDEIPHCFFPLFPGTKITFAHGLPNEFRDGSLFTPCACVQGIPRMIVEVKLCAA